MEQQITYQHWPSDLTDHQYRWKGVERYALDQMCESDGPLEAGRVIHFQSRLVHQQHPKKSKK